MVRKTKKPIDASSLLKSSSGTLAQIASKTNSLTLLADIVRQICPDLPLEVWHIGNFRQNCIVIEVISAIWGQRLQFERVKICQQLAIATDNEFTQITIKISPYRNTQSLPKSTEDIKPRFLSHKTAKQLNEVAKNAPESLKIKLQNLANLANQNKD